jgi:hypothetical protein
VHGDRVGVDGDSAGGDADLASVDDTNTKRKFDWAHEIDLFSAVYEWKLRFVNEWRYVGNQHSENFPGTHR